MATGFRYQNDTGLVALTDDARTLKHLFGPYYVGGNNDDTIVIPMPGVTPFNTVVTSFRTGGQVNSDFFAQNRQVGEPGFDEILIWNFTGYSMYVMAFVYR